MPATPPSEPPIPARRHMRAVWTFCGILSLGFGFLGIFLPVLPTTPLVLLAAFCFSKGSPRLRAWLLRHPRFGAAILDWEATGAIPRRVKYLACGAMILTWVISAYIGLRWQILVAQALLMGVGITYVLTRPDR